jgi:hypothetical protein
MFTHATDVTAAGEVTALRRQVLGAEAMVSLLKSPSRIAADEKPDPGGGQRSAAHGERSTAVARRGTRAIIDAGRYGERKTPGQLASELDYSA